jgi:S-adenosylmethionine:tRNA ribosyltransferase-isomerase
VARTLESSARRHNGTVEAGAGETSLFVYPGFAFSCLVGLLTNFHLPRSTLLILVSAFAGRETILRAYQQAIDARYRFYSYGDCMLII